MRRRCHRNCLLGGGRRTGSSTCRCARERSSPRSPSQTRECDCCPPLPAGSAYEGREGKRLCTDSDRLGGGQGTATCSPDTCPLVYGERATSQLTCSDSPPALLGAHSSTDTIDRTTDSESLVSRPRSLRCTVETRSCTGQSPANWDSSSWSAPTCLQRLCHANLLIDHIAHAKQDDLSSIGKNSTEVENNVRVSHHLVDIPFCLIHFINGR